MKTSELRRLLKNSGESFSENEICFESGQSYWYIFKNEQIINVSFVDRQVVASALTDYFLTPISEREEEKKYYLQLNSYFVKFNVCYHKHNEIYGFIKAHELNDGVQVMFTEKEIEQMPLRFTEAINCAFLDKVEVNI